MKALKFPIIPITIFLALGIVFGSYLNFDFLFILATNSLTLLSFSFFYFHKKQKNFIYFFGFTTYILAFQLGIALQYFHCEKNQKKHYTHFVSNHEKVLLEGIIKNSAKPSKTKNKYIAQITKINTNSATGKTLIYVPKEEKINLKPGSHFSVITNLIPIKDNFNPYQFNYSKYIEKQNIYHQIYTSARDLKINKQEKNFDFYLYDIRENLITSFKKHQFSHKTQ